MSRLVLVSVVSSLAAALACGSSARDDSLFSSGGGGPAGGQASVPADVGSGGVSSSAGGGTSASGGTGVATESRGAGGEGLPDSAAGGSTASGGAEPGTDAGRLDIDASGAGGTTSSGGAMGDGGTPGGAWARCTKDADCTGGRVCTQSSQSLIVSGRSGACVHKCPITSGAASCDPGLPGGNVSCTQLLVTSYCSITCLSGSNGCPSLMDCVAGYCFYSN